MITDEMFIKANSKTIHDWTVAKLERAKAAYESGKPTKEIAEEIGYSWAAIFRALKIIGCTMRPRGGKPSLSDHDKEQVRHLLKKFTQQEIADAYGVDRGVIQKVHAAEKKRLAELGK